MNKLYTADQIEFDKYYIKGSSRAYNLLERTGKIVENHSDGSSSKVYKFQIIDINTGVCDVSEVVLKDSWTCFNCLDRKRIEEIISHQKRYIENLETVLNGR
jgi:hypothetical protein